MRRVLLFVTHMLLRHRMTGKYFIFPILTRSLSQCVQSSGTRCTGPLNLHSLKHSCKWLSLGNWPLALNSLWNACQPKVLMSYKKKNEIKSLPGFNNNYPKSWMHVFWGLNKYSFKKRNWWDNLQDTKEKPSSSTFKVIFPHSAPQSGPGEGRKEQNLNHWIWL